MGSISMGLFESQMRLLSEIEVVLRLSNQIHDSEWRAGIYKVGSKNSHRG